MVVRGVQFIPAIVQKSRSRTMGIVVVCEEDKSVLYVNANSADHVDGAESVCRQLDPCCN